MGSIGAWDIILTTTSSVSIIACIWFQILYHKFLKKTLALRMIAILSLSNLICHISEVLITFLSEKMELTLSNIFNIFLLFTIIWSSSIAFIVSNSVSKVRMNDPERYFKWSLFLFFVISGILCAS